MELTVPLLLQSGQKFERRVFVMSILEVNRLKKTYTTRFGGNKVEALKNVSFSVEKGEYVAIMGESGSGKTTLLNILASLDKPTGGSVSLDGMDLSKIKESRLAEFRRDNLGFVFQEFNLLDTLSVEDNIYLPLVLAGKSHVEMEEKIKPIAHKLGIMELLKKYPYEISGGQKQRRPGEHRREPRNRLLKRNFKSTIIRRFDTQRCNICFTRNNSRGIVNVRLCQIASKRACRFRVNRALPAEDKILCRQRLTV